MWLITLVQFLFASLFAGLGQHLIAYLNDVGYSPTVAARVLSMLFVFTTVGSLISGPMAESSQRALRNFGDLVRQRNRGTGLGWRRALLRADALCGAGRRGRRRIRRAASVANAGVARHQTFRFVDGNRGRAQHAWLCGRTGRHRMDSRPHSGSYVPALWLAVGLSILCVIACLACRPLQSVLDERASREAA